MKKKNDFHWSVGLLSAFYSGIMSQFSTNYFSPPFRKEKALEYFYHEDFPFNLSNNFLNSSISSCPLYKISPSIDSLFHENQGGYCFGIAMKSVFNFFEGSLLSLEECLFSIRYKLRLSNFENSELSEVVRYQKINCLKDIDFPEHINYRVSLFDGKRARFFYIINQIRCFL